MATGSPLDFGIQLVRPGEMVVAVSEILDAIGNRITPEEKQKLLLAVLARRAERVQPGDLITASLINGLLADMADLKAAQGSRPGAGPPGSAKPAEGNVLVARMAGPPGIAPGSKTEHRYRITNDTDQALEWLLSVKVDAATGDWRGAVRFENGAVARTLRLASRTSAEVLVLLQTPNDAKVGEKAALQLSVSTSPPHPQDDLSTTTLDITAIEQPVAPFAVDLLRAVLPASGFQHNNDGSITGTIPQNRQRTVAWPLRFDGDTLGQAPKFSAEVQLSASTPATEAGIKAWEISLNDGAAASDTLSADKLVRTLRWTIAPVLGQQTQLRVGITAPAQAQKVRLTASVSWTHPASDASARSPDVDLTC